VPGALSTAICSGLPARRRRAHLLAMGSKSRETIYGASVRVAADRAEEARKQADRLAVEAWNKRMLAFKGPAQPSPTLGEALNAGYAHLEVRCLGCDTHQTVSLDIVCRSKTTPIHELERYTGCKDCSQVRGYPHKRSHLVALRATTISASDLPSARGAVTMNTPRLIGLAAALWVMIAAPALAAPQCVEMPAGRTLEAETKAGKSTDEIVEALLRDADKLYAEAGRIVGQRPRTKSESYALQEKDFLIEECHFQSAFTSTSKAEAGVPDRLKWTLIRIEQFDNFIFDAVGEAIACSNTEAGLRLQVSRALLDHAWTEFKGDTKERDWDPKVDWPETHESCYR
jgi:hypothetical protein